MSEQASPEYVLFETDHFRIEHSIYYRIAGFLFVVPKNSVSSISSMDSSAIDELGKTLQLAVRAVESVVSPENVYCTKFGESDGSVHFHIFPRTRELTDQYTEDEQADGPIDGPRIMSWANNRYIGEKEHGNIDQSIAAFKTHFLHVA